MAELLLKDAKSNNGNYSKEIIVHMTINDYLIDDKYYLSCLENLNYRDISQPSLYAFQKLF